MRHARPSVLSFTALVFLLIPAACDQPGPDELAVTLPDGVEVIGLAISEAGPNPADIALPLTNLGTCPLAYTVTSTTSSGGTWLSVTPSTGTVNAMKTTDLAVHIDVVSTVLRPGTYAGNIHIEGTCQATGRRALGSPLSVGINITVTPFNAAASVGTHDIVVDGATLADAWSPLSPLGAPTPEHYKATVAWTGYEAIVFGGSIHKYDNSGWAYEPVTDTWRPIAPAPTSRAWNSAVSDPLTGAMIVFGGGVWDGHPAIAQAEVYDPENDGWWSTSTVGEPTPRASHSAVWTGQEMIIWGGFGASGNNLATGGIWNRTTNNWRPTATLNAPAARINHYAVWTGSEMIVWGGVGNAYFSDGGAYNPVTDTWRSLSATDAPTGEGWSGAVWTGREMIVWGGDDPLQYPASVNSGAAYDPVSDRWRTLSVVGAPTARHAHTMLWTGSRVIVWGGNDPITTSSGGLYDPTTDTWSAMSEVDASAPRGLAAAIWTGSQMFIWGGTAGGVAVPSGALYE